ncbi:hypothetical protein [Dyella sp.]|uniref:YXWGXW repeat-containing protein n=1 Tax=Dyella sp. TaxID=1869338 RepID=UPI002B47DE68|nr:hypothetical protein [Dyella sp.]HKT27522.1 hypothetical protein [Dyella sp.]
MKTISLTQHVSMKRTLLVRALAGLLGAIAALAALPQKAEAGVYIGVGVSVGVPPPPLPVYEQPPIPGPGYIWTPGYWAWDGAEYYWVPGTWVIAPFYGALWTPGYWGWNDGFYVFHRGYWGYHVGFYGGINYGCGYTGVGYAGGYWGHGGFYYNRTVNRINNVHITNVYNKTVINNVNVNRVSYNGGRGGVMAHATPQEAAFARQSRMGPIAAQQRQMTLASHNPAMRASFNHGDPPIAATQRPGAFNGAGVTPAHGSQFTPTAFNAQRMNNNVVHAPQTANNGPALRSANFAPHANTPATANMARPGGSYSNVYRPGGVTGVAPASHAARPAMNTYRAPTTAYRPAPAFHAAPAYRPQPQYRAPAAPQYHAFRPAPAPHPSGGAPHGGGGGHDSRHG